MRKAIISYSAPRKRPLSEAWYLATNTDTVQFYCFDPPDDRESPIAYTLIGRLDRTALTGAGDKATAVNWAKRMGLTNWAYVRM